MLIFPTILSDIPTENSNVTTEDTVTETLPIKPDTTDDTKTPDKTIVENKSWLQKLSAFTRGYFPVVAWLYHNTRCCSSCRDRATEFIEAVKSGDVSTCEKLMNDNVLVNARDTDTKYPLNTPLHWAVYYKNKDIINLLFASRNTNFFKMAWHYLIGTLTYIDLENKAGNTALHVAAIQQCDEIIPMLIEQNAKINRKNKMGETPLLCASRHGHATTISLLLEHNAQLDAVNNKKQNALHIATIDNRETVVNLLATHEELINTPDNNGNTPLIYAVQHDNCVIAERLLKHGADSSVKTCEGDTLAHLCVKKNNLEMLKILIKDKVDINEHDNNKLTPFEVAIKKDYANFVELFINNNVLLKNDSLVLHFAIENKSHDIIEKILLYKPDTLNILNAEDMTPLQLAITKGYASITKTLLDHKADVTHRTNDGETALSLAAAYGHVYVIRLLANYSAVNINSQNNKKQTPLMKAVMNCHPAAFKTLLELGADTEITDDQENTVLHIAVQNNQKETVQELIAKNEKLIEMANEQNQLPLIIAIKRKYYLLTQLLIESRSPLNHLDASGQAPLHYGVQQDNKKLALELLQHGADVNIQTEHGFTPLHLAAQVGNNQFIRDLLKHKADTTLQTKIKQDTALHIAIQNNHFDSSELLITSNNVYLKNDKGDTALHLAVRKQPLNSTVQKQKRVITQKILSITHDAINIANNNYYTALHIASEQGDVQQVKDLLAHNANTELKTNKCDTPLHLALFHNHDAIAELLISKTNLNIKNGEKNTPLHLVVLQKKPNLELAKKILYVGCDVDVKNGKDLTPLHIAAKNGYNGLVKCLLRYNADGTIRTANGNTALLVALLAEQYDTAALLIDGYTIRVRNNNGDTALHIAVRQGHFLTVKKLIDKKAKVNIANKSFGNTPLHEAATQSDLKIIELLLQHTANVNVKNNQGNAPIHCAIHAGNEKTLKVMISYNVDPNIPDKNDDTPLCIAAATGNLSMVNILLSYHRTKVDGKNGFGYTPLALATLNGNIKVMKMLYKNGASVSTQTENDDTLLHLAAQGGHHSAVEFLISHNVPQHAINKQGRTPFITAAVNGYLNIVRTFMESASCTAENIDDAIKHAKEKGQYPIVECLEQLKTECTLIMHTQQTLSTIEQKNRELDIAIMQKAQEEIEVDDIYIPLPCYEGPPFNLTELLKRESSERKQIMKKLFECRNREQQENTRLEQKLKKMHASQEQDNERDENDQEQETSECCICSEEKTSAGPIPCKHFRKGSARICPECLEECKKRSDKCPTCNLPTLNKGRDLGENSTTP